MKKFISVLLIISLVFSFTACGKSEGNFTTTSYSTEVGTSAETTAPVTTSEESTSSKEQSSAPSSDESAPEASPMDNIKNNASVTYGKNTGTNKTYTGLEPLPEVTLPVVDPDNLRGLSTEAMNHSYGVSTGGEPHEISVNNQKIYDEYGGLCLDTSGEKVIYLTFDCGYENGCTEKILDTLKDKNVKAAFFVTLDHVKSSPEIVSRMINEGHIVGNHSTTHPNFSAISRTRMVEEIQTLDNYLRTKFGYSAPFFRFPEGACSQNALELVQSIGYTSVFWSSAYADWDTTNSKGAQYAFDTVTSRLHPGCVLLLHAVSYDNADALGDIIDYAKKEGYTFKALGE